MSAFFSKAAVKNARLDSVSMSAFGQKQTSASWHVHSECPLSGEKRTLRLGTLTQILTETFGQLRTLGRPQFLSIELFLKRLDDFARIVVGYGTSTSTVRHLLRART